MRYGRINNMLIKLPLPPRINDKYVSRKFVLKAEYRQYLEQAKLFVPAKIKYYESEQLKLYVAFHISRDRDIDSSIKPLLDAMQGRIYKNDSQVVAMDVIKVKVPKGDECCYLTVEVYRGS